MLASTMTSKHFTSVVFTRKCVVAGRREPYSFGYCMHELQGHKHKSVLLIMFWMKLCKNQYLPSKQAIVDSIASYEYLSKMLVATSINFTSSDMKILVELTVPTFNCLCSHDIFMTLGCSNCCKQLKQYTMTNIYETMHHAMKIPNSLPVPWRT